jgi:hypothetical protein
MQWGPVRDRIVEGQQEKIRCWLLMTRQERVHAIYIKIDEVSKFLPEDEFEETLEGAKLRAEIEVERYFKAIETTKPKNKKRV